MQGQRLGEYVSEELTETIDRILGKLSRIVFGAAIGSLVVVAGAAAFVTRLDMRLAVVETKQVETVQQLRILNERIAPSAFVEREMGEIKLEQRRQQLQIDVLECRESGSSAAECRSAVESYTGRR